MPKETSRTTERVLKHIERFEKVGKTDLRLLFGGSYAGAVRRLLSKDKIIYDEKNRTYLLK